MIKLTKLLSRFQLTFKYGAELEDLLREAHNAKIEAARLQKAKNLNLCWDHQQEDNHSHFSKHNCDYCKLLVNNFDNEPAYKTLKEFEELIGIEVNDKFKMGWDMARTTNKMIGIKIEDE